MKLYTVIFVIGFVIGFISHYFYNMIIDTEDVKNIADAFQSFFTGIGIFITTIGVSYGGISYYMNSQKIRNYKKRFPVTEDKTRLRLIFMTFDIPNNKQFYLLDFREGKGKKYHFDNMQTVKDLNFYPEWAMTIPEREFNEYENGEEIDTKMDDFINMLLNKLSV